MIGRPTIRHMTDWAIKPGKWHGRVTGADLDGPVSILFFSGDQDGDGPPLHTHPYDEIFICRAGRARFIIGNREIVAQEGDILIAPANVPHKFAVVGPNRYESIDIHCNAEVIQHNLE
jgi:mannose-6-phosphate isomerase-like protein (cupin superfamily)